MPRYTVISPLRRNGESYPVGSEIDLTEAQAAPLLPHTVELLAEQPAEPAMEPDEQPAARAAAKKAPAKKTAR